MGTVAEFIERIKQREGFKFDGQVAKILDVDSRQLATYKSRNSLPNKYQEWYCSKYDVKFKDFHEDIELVNKNINIKREDSVVDARYIIDLQKEKIEHQQAEINRLTAIVHKQKETKNKPAFHFKTKCNYEFRTCTFSNHEVYGDVNMTGFTLNELNSITAEKWSERFHPDSLQTIMATTNSDPPVFVHNIWKHILWKSKDDKYLMFNIESYYSRDEKVIRSYYYWVNGDIEGKS
tara:strand:- start:582 stop:1286 length:705 start_codon:yes stop_codon:yes gene_type:complete